MQKKMKRIYEKNEIHFAFFLVLMYGGKSILPGNDTEAGIILRLIYLLAVAGGCLAFIRENHLEDKYGLSVWPRSLKDNLIFMPMWLLATGNLWGGIKSQEITLKRTVSVLLMVIAGYTEELIFRGFVLMALIPKMGRKKAVIVSAIVFGCCHLGNLLSASSAMEWAMQVVFATAWGFILASVSYRSRCLFPGMIAHAAVNAFSEFSRQTIRFEWINLASTIAVVVCYGLYFSRDAQDQDSFFLC